MFQGGIICEVLKLVDTEEKMRDVLNMGTLSNAYDLFSCFLVLWCIMFQNGQTHFAASICFKVFKVCLTIMNMD